MINGRPAAEGDALPENLNHIPNCDGCGGHYNRLFDAFMNERGFVRLCAGCVAPQRGPTRAYTGPYPIRSTKAAPTLRLITGDKAR